MNNKTHKKLFEDGFLNEKQFKFLNAIAEKQLFSVYYELRILLYLGILLFTTGVSLLVYSNLGDLGHYIALFVILIIGALCFKYVLDKEIPFSQNKIESPSPYYDYALLLGTILLITLQGYLHYLFNIFDGVWEWSTLINSLILFSLAYRFDHIGLLTMAITALTSFVGITISPQNWIEHELIELKEIYNVGIFLSLILAATGIYLDHKVIKKHFTFTYLNFASLIFFFCVFTGLFNSNWYFLLIVIGVAGCIFYANWKKSFLFLIYGFLSAYYGITYLLVELLDNVDSLAVVYLWAIYTIVSCVGFMAFVMKYKNYYKKQ